MKDYERLYRACQVLDAYNIDNADYNLNPDHDVIQLCFDVSEDHLTLDDKKELDELGCMYIHGVWKMFISC